jgi:hypothetical protein
MRQGQQNRRGRGRNNGGGNNHHNNNNNSRKAQNPMARSFESNGPEVKIRGNAAHIAEKYMSLARDAQSSGDPVLAENYLQHAEHYNRIILAYREQQATEMGHTGQGAQPGGQPRMDQGTDLEAGGGEEAEDFSGDGGSAQVIMRNQEAQPRQYDNGGGSHSRGDDRGYRQNNDHQSRQHSNRDYRDRDRQPNDNRGYQDRGDRRPQPNDRQERQERFDRGDRPERFDRDRDRAGQGNGPSQDARGGDNNFPRRRERPPMPDRGPQEAHEQPEFLRRPVRRPRRDDADAEPVATGSDEGGNE